MSDFNIQFEEQDQSITLEFEQIGGGAVKSVNGKTGVVVLDADDVGAYTKPTGGIPKTDLASAVQTSLGKADSAYQKPSGGIPAGDIASGVVPAVDNTLTVSGAAADAKKVGDELSDVKDGLTAVESDVTDLKEDLSVLNIEDIINYTPISIGEVDTSYYVTVSNSGTIYFNNALANYGAYKIEVKPNTRYKIYNYAYYGQKWAITDANNNLLQYDKTIYSVNSLTPVGSFITTDERAKWLYLPYRDVATNVVNSTGKIRLKGGIVLEESAERGKLALASYWNASSTTQGFYFPQNDKNYTTTIVPVKAGDKYFCHGWDIYNLPSYAVFDDNFTPVLISNDLAYNNSAVLRDAVVTIEKSGFMLLTQRNATGNSVAYAINLDKKIKGKKWDAVGDSFTASNTLSGKPNYVDFITASLDLDTSNHGVGGTGYNTVHGDNAFYNVATNIRSDADIVTVFGSFNDLPSEDSPVLGDVTDTGTTTIAGCMANTFINIRAKAPDAMILCIAPSPWKTNNNVTGRASWASINPWDYVDMLERICRKYNIVYLDLYNHSDTAPWLTDFESKYQADGTHPNSLGHYKYIYPFVKHKLLQMFD